jgi:hypothetical protein
MTEREGQAGETIEDHGGAPTNGVVHGLRPVPADEPAPRSGGAGPFDLDARQRGVLLAVLVIHILLARFTLRDLRRRPASAVRGPKRLWRIWATLNTSGSVAYLLVGRRRRPSDLPA